MERKFYETPILYANFRENLIKTINASRLMPCEMLPIFKEVLQELNATVVNEYNAALEQMKLEKMNDEDVKQKEETKEK